VRRAAALPVVLLALALLAALVLGTSFVTRRMSANARIAERAALLTPLAEELLVESVAGWDSAGRAGQPVGSTASLGSVDRPTGRVSGWVTRVSPSLYWLVAAADPGSAEPFRRRMGVLVCTATGLPALVSGRAWGELP